MQKRLRFTAVAIILAWAGCANMPEDDAVPSTNALVGTWKVDLRPTPEADPYYQEFVVESVDGDSIRGTFYGTAIQNSSINTDWGSVHFAFTTGDGSGAYNTSGVLSGKQLRGTTHSLGRGFLAVWTAELSQ